MRKILLLCLCIIAMVAFAVWVPNTVAQVGCTDDGDCDDGLFCNGIETCEAGTGTCQPGTAPCDPATEICNEDTDTCDIITSIDIRKQGEGPDSRTFASGSDVPFEIVVTNTGQTDLVNVEVTDDNVPDCAQFIGDLAAGASVSYTCTALNVTASFENVACVTGQENGVQVQDCDPSTVEIIDIDIRKQGEGPDTRAFQSGSDVPFEIVVTNTGDEDLENVVVADIMVPDCDRNIGFLAAGDSVTYPCTALNVTEDFVNEACVTGERNGVTLEDCDPSDVEVTTLNVYLDVKPGSCPNPLNVKSRGLVPVAILGTEDFDVTTIDPASLRLIGAVAPIRWDLEDVATPFNGVSSDDCLDCTELGPDDIDDLTVKFKAQEIAAALGDVEDGACVLLELTGETIDGIQILGTDIGLIINK